MVVSISEMEDRLTEIDKKVDLYHEMIDDEIFRYESGEEYFLDRARNTAYEMADIIDREGVDPTGADDSEIENIMKKVNNTEGRVADAGVKYTGDGDYMVSEELPNEEFSLGHIYRETITNTQAVNDRHNYVSFFDYLFGVLENGGQE